MTLSKKDYIERISELNRRIKACLTVRDNIDELIKKYKEGKITDLEQKLIAEELLKNKRKEKYVDELDKYIDKCINLKNKYSAELKINLTMPALMVICLLLGSLLFTQVPSFTGFFNLNNDAANMSVTAYDKEAKQLEKDLKKAYNKLKVTKIEKIDELNDRFDVNIQLDSKINSLRNNNVKLNKIKLSDLIELSIAKTDDPVIKTDVLNIIVPNITSEIFLVKKGKVSKIVKCTEWDDVSNSCVGEWIITKTPFAQNKTHISFEITESGIYAGAEITVINVQSYPMVGGTWTVAFETVGKANLIITPFNGTTWSDSTETEDLKLLEIKCGNNVLDYEWDGDSVIVYDYECSENGYETSKVLTEGKHSLRFDFGNDTAYAYNDASNVILNSTYGYNTTNENLTVYYSATNSVANITDWRVNGRSIAVFNYPFENHTNAATNATDYSTNKFNATVVGATLTTNGYRGRAYLFDGINDYVLIPGNTQITNITRNLTLEAWIKLASGNRVNPIIQNGFYVGSTYMLSVEANNNVSWYVRPQSGFGVIIYSTPLNIGQWYHIVATYNYDASNVSLYVNGNLMSSTTLTGPIFGDYLNDISIGRKQNYMAATNYFNGTIDEVKIYNRTLSPEQILALYNNRTDLIVSQETKVGETWSVAITTNDGQTDGNTVLSNNLTIDNNAAPVLSNLVLNSTYGTNLTTENLTAYWTTYDFEGDPVFNITDWRINGTSIAVLNMPFEGGSNSTFTKDYSTYGNNGTVNGATWNATGGYRGTGAYYFDGNGDYINTNVSIPDLKNNWTITAWIKSNNAASGWGWIVGETEVSTFVFGKQHSENYLHVNIEGCGFWNNIQNTQVFDGIWHHVVLRNNAGTLSVFVDGSLASNLGTGCNSPSSTGKIRIGSRTLSFNEYLNATLDDVMIFNRPLSAEQIKALYNNRTDLIVEQETKVGETWTACITPNDGYEDGTTVCSNNLTILAPPPNNPPNITWILLNSTYGTNLTNENLTVYWSAEDEDNDSIINITDWRVNGRSIAVFNYPFENHTNAATNATDYSTNKFNATVVGATLTTNGYRGRAYLFDGINDYVLIPGNTQITNITRNLTLEAWIKLASGNRINPIIQNGYYSGTTYLLNIETTNNVSWYIRPQSGYGVTIYSTPLNIGQWYHIVATYNYDASNVSLYVDGNLMSSTTLTGPIFGDYLNDISVGRKQNFMSASNYFNGTIDEVKIYNRTLSPEQIKALYNNRTDLIVEQETKVGDVWSVAVTPNDRIEDGTTILSNNLTILAPPPNNPPNITWILLNSTYGTNLTTENLTVYWSAEDEDNDSIINITDWRINGTSIAVLNMPFEGGSNSTFTKDYSTYGHNGTVINATLVDGKTGKGYSFDKSNSYLKISNPQDFTYENFTIMMWVKPNILYKAGSVSADGFFDVYQNETNRFFLNYDKNYGAGNITLYENLEYKMAYTINLSADVWVHIALTVNSNDTAELYLNGTKVANSTTVRGLDELSPVNVIIGAGYLLNTIQNPFNGTFDNVLAFNRALSSEQIKEIYDNDFKTIHSKETKIGENWAACITPNDGYEDGTTVCSNNLTIANVVHVVQIYPNASGEVQNITPEQTSISTYGKGSFTENLTFNVTAVSEEPEQLWYYWFVNGILKFIQSLFSGLASTFSYLFNESGTYNITVIVNNSDNSARDEFMFNLSVTCRDDDGDGANATFNCGPVDCDDTNPKIFPPFAGANLSGAVQFCSGNYTITDYLLVNTSNVEITCNGTTLIGSRNQFLTVLNFTDTENITVKNCVIINFSTGIYMNQIRNVLLLNNTFNENFNNLVADYSENVIIENNSMYDSSIGLYSSLSKNLSIKNNIILNSIQTGLILPGANNSIIFDNLISGVSSGHGIDLYGESNNISSNNISNTGAHGISSSCSNCIIYGNSIYNATYEGAYIYGNNNSILNNNLNKIGRYGFYLSGSFNNITNNTINNSDVSLLISIFFSQNNTFENNQHKNSNIGYLIQNMLNTIKNDEFSGNTIDILTNISENNTNTLILTEGGSSLIFDNKILNVTNMQNLYVNSSIAAVNSSAEPQMNISANISLYAGGCTPYLFVNPEFYKDLDLAKQNAELCTVCENVSCSDGIVQFQVPYFSTYFSNFIPVITQIYPNATNESQNIGENDTEVSISVGVGTNQTFIVNATDDDTDVLTFTWIVKKFGEIIQTVIQTITKIGGIFTSIFSFLFNETGDYNITVTVNESLPVNDTFTFKTSIVCVDNDGDGFNTSADCGVVDCNDNDPDVLPYIIGGTTTSKILCPGTYIQPIVSYLNGSNIDIFCNQTILIGLSTSMIALNMTGDGGVNNISVHGCTFINFSTAVQFSNVQQGSIYNNTFINISGQGLLLVEDTAGIDIYNNSFLKNNYAIYAPSLNSTKIFSNLFNGSTNTVMNLPASNNLSILNNTIINSLKGTDGVSAFNWLIKNNSIINITDFGIYLSYGSNNTIEENFLSDNSGYGIRTFGNIDMKIKNNIITGNDISSSYSGIYAFNDVRLWIYNNTIYNSGKAIRAILYDSNITHNKIFNNTYGIEATTAYGGANILIYSNELENNSEAAFYTSTSIRANITNNIIKNNKYGVNLRDLGNSYFANNNLSENKAGAIRIAESEGSLYYSIIENNTIINNNGTALYAYISSSSIISNEFINNTGIAIHLSEIYGGGTDNLIKNNYINGSYTGILLENRRTNITNNTIIATPYGIELYNENNTILKNLFDTPWDIFDNTSSNNLIWAEGNNSLAFYSKKINVSDVENLYINQSITYVNVSAEPIMNVSANITFEVPGCTPRIFRAEGLYKDIASAKTNAVLCTICENISCSGNLFSFQVPYFSTYFINFTPIVTTIFPNATNETQQVPFGQTNVTVTQRPGANVTFNATITDYDSNAFTFRWFVDGILRFTETIVDLFSSIFSWLFNHPKLYNVTVMINDSEYTESFTWFMNITNNKPNITWILLNSTFGTNLTNENLTVYWSAEDEDNDSIINITDWRINGTSIAVLNMPFEGGSNSTFTKDYSTYGNNGTVTGATWSSTAGYNGFGAYYFDGNGDYIETIDGEIGNLSQFTFTTWIKLDEELPNNINTIFTKMNFSENSQFQFEIDYKEDINSTRILISTAEGTHWNFGWEPATNSISRNEWHHLAITWEGSLIKYYVDGVQVDNASLTGTIKDFPNNKIRAGYSLGNQYFKGYIDDIKFMNRALSEEQIKALYNNRTDLIVEQETNVGETWTACITPNDGYEDGTTVCSNNLTIINAKPTTPILIYPNDGNNTLTELQPYFNWTASTDADGDNISYEINITSELCNGIFETGLTDTNFTPAEELGVFEDCGTYNWTVRAYDGTQYSEWATIFNFSIASQITIFFVNNETNFSQMLEEQSDDTTDNSPPPMTIQSDSNVLINLSLKALDELFVAQPLDTEYFQFMAGESVEANSFNVTQSQNTWANVSSTYKHFVALLKYENSSDLAELELKVKVPSGEGAGQRNSTLQVLGSKS